jgi:hypothetical protein
MEAKTDNRSDANGGNDPDQNSRDQAGSLAPAPSLVSHPLAPSVLRPDRGTNHGRC